MLDEATSSIDFATDLKIQATIREEFGSSLLLTGDFLIHCILGRKQMTDDVWVAQSHIA